MVLSNVQHEDFMQTTNVILNRNRDDWILYAMMSPTVDSMIYWHPKIIQGCNWNLILVCSYLSRSDVICVHPGPIMSIKGFRWFQVHIICSQFQFHCRLLHCDNLCVFMSSFNRFNLPVDYLIQFTSLLWFTEFR